MAVTYDFAVLVAPSSVGEGVLPTVFALKRNAPNPFNPMTMIKYELPVDGRMVRLEIFNISGKRIRTLVSETQSAGYHEVMWNGKDEQGVQPGSGVYLIRLVTRHETVIRSVLLLK